MDRINPAKLANGTQITITGRAYKEELQEAFRNGAVWALGTYKTGEPVTMAAISKKVNDAYPVVTIEPNVVKVEGRELWLKWDDERGVVPYIEESCQSAAIYTPKLDAAFAHAMRQVLSMPFKEKG